MTQSLEEALQQLKEKVAGLVAQNTILSSENEELVGQVLDLQEQLRVKENKIDEFENNRVNLHDSSPLNKDEIKKYNQAINEILKEIDKGIELLKSEQ